MSAIVARKNGGEQVAGRARNQVVEPDAVVRMALRPTLPCKQ